jgi:hypothetical protein
MAPETALPAARMIAAEGLGNPYRVLVAGGEPARAVGLSVSGPRDSLRSAFRSPP